MSDSKIDPREVRSKQAKALLADPVLVGILDAMIGTATQDWISSPHDQPAVREAAWHRVRAVQAVKNELDFAARDFAVRNFNQKSRA